MCETYSTDTVAQRERIEYWIDAICDAYVRLGCDTTERGGFSGKIDLSSVGSCQLSIVTASGQHVTRRRLDISRSDREYFLMSVQLSGTGCVRQADRETKLLPGEFALYSSIAPYELYFPGPFSQLVVQVPRDAIVGSIPIADMLTAMPVSRSNPAGQLVVRTLTDINRTVRACTESSARHLETVIGDLVGCGMAQLADGHAVEDRKQELLLVLRMKSYIAANLSRPGLSRHDVASALGMSVRRVNEILAKRETSISRCIERERVRRVTQDFSNPAQAEIPIGAIAARWGFDDAQHFSKWFRRKVGSSPSEYRSRALIDSGSKDISLS